MEHLCGITGRAVKRRFLNSADCQEWRSATQKQRNTYRIGTRALDRAARICQKMGDEE